MKEMTFEQVASQFDPLIKSQIRNYNLRSRFDQYYQAGLLGLWNAYETFDPEKGQFSSYAFLKVRGRILQEFRGEMRRLEKEDNQDPHESFVFKNLSHTDTIPFLEDESLNLYLVHLTQNQQRWVIHRICEMKSEAEIAEMFDVSVYAVKSWRKAAIKKLRSVLNTK